MKNLKRVTGDGPPVVSPRTGNGEHRQSPPSYRWMERNAGRREDLPKIITIAINCPGYARPALIFRMFNFLMLNSEVLDLPNTVLTVPLLNIPSTVVTTGRQQVLTWMKSIAEMAIGSMRQ